MSAWQPGAACLVFGEWPAYVEAVGARGTVRVRFVGGSPELGLANPLTVAADRLVAPHAPHYLHRDRTRRGKRHEWTAAEVATLRAEWGSAPDAEVAARLGRTVAACRITLWRWYGSKAGHYRRALSARQVATILGVDPSYVVRVLIRRHLLPATKGARGGCYPVWRVTDDALEQFLRRYPQHYDPHRVTAHPWARIAREAHGDDPFLTPAEVAALIGVAEPSVSGRIVAGTLRAVWSHGGRAGSNRGWLIRRSDALAIRDLPCRPPTYPKRDRAFRARGLVSVREAAAALGRDYSTVLRYVQRGQLPAQAVHTHGRRFVGIPRAALEVPA